MPTDTFRDRFEIVRIDADPAIVRIARRTGGPPFVAIQGDHARLFADAPPTDPGLPLPTAGNLAAILAAPELGRFRKRKAVAEALEGAEFVGVQATVRVPDRYAEALELLREVEREIGRAIGREQAAAGREDADAILRLRGIDPATYDEYQRLRVAVADDPDARRLLAITGGDPIDPAAAWGNVTRDILDWRREAAIKDISPLDPLAGAFGAVVLRGIDEPPIVFGVQVEVLREEQYYAVLSLVRAGQNGLTKADLDAGGEVADPVNVLRRLKARHPQTWGRAILLPGGKGKGGYRIAPSR